MSEFLMKDIIPKDVQSWEFVEIEGSFPARIYFKPRLNENGFDFNVFEIVGQYCDSEYWDEEGSQVEVFVQGTAYYDGIRHLYFGDESTENYGYHYYPNLDLLIKVMEELKKLESKYCQDI